MKTRFNFSFVPEHADDMQRRRFIERQILDSTVRAVSGFHSVSIGLPTDTNALDALAARLCRDIEPTKQTMPALTDWFQGGR